MSKIKIRRGDLIRFNVYGNTLTGTVTTTYRCEDILDGLPDEIAAKQFIRDKLSRYGADWTKTFWMADVESDGESYSIEPNDYIESITVWQTAVTFK